MPNHVQGGLFPECAPTRIRTEVLALKGLRPGPLDDGGMLSAAGFYHRLQIGSSLTQNNNSLFQFYKGDVIIPLRAAKGGFIK